MSGFLWVPLAVTAYLTLAAVSARTLLRWEAEESVRRHPRLYPNGYRIDGGDLAMHAFGGLFWPIVLPLGFLLYGRIFRLVSGRFIRAITGYEPEDRP